MAATGPVLAVRGIAHLDQVGCGRRTICPDGKRPLPGVEFRDAGVAEGAGWCDGHARKVAFWAQVSKGAAAADGTKDDSEADDN